MNKLPIGKAVRLLREERGLSREQLAEKSDYRLKTSWITNLERGQNKHSTPDKLEIVAKILGVSVPELWRRAGYDDIPIGQTPEEYEIVQLVKSFNRSDRARAMRILRELAQEEPLVTHKEEGRDNL